MRGAIRVLGTTNVVFGAGESGIDLDPALVALPIRGADPMLHAVLCRHVAERLQGIATRWSRPKMRRTGSRPTAPRPEPCGASGGTSGTSGGSSGTSGSSGAGGCGTITWKTPACSSCMASSCCAQQKACTDNQACAALLSCLIGCQDNATCQNACGTSNPSGVSDYTAVATCFDTCKTECQ